LVWLKLAILPARKSAQALPVLIGDELLKFRKP